MPANARQRRAAKQRKKVHDQAFAAASAGLGPNATRAPPGKEPKEGANQQPDNTSSLTPMEKRLRQQTEFREKWKNGRTDEEKMRQFRRLEKLRTAFHAHPSWFLFVERSNFKVLEGMARAAYDDAMANSRYPPLWLFHEWIPMLQDWSAGRLHNATDIVMDEDLFQGWIRTLGPNGRKYCRRFPRWWLTSLLPRSKKTTKQQKTDDNDDDDNGDDMHPKTYGAADRAAFDAALDKIFVEHSEYPHQVLYDARSELPSMIWSDMDELREHLWCIATDDNCINPYVSVNIYNCMRKRFDPDNTGGDSSTAPAHAGRTKLKTHNRQQLAGPGPGSGSGSGSGQKSQGDWKRHNDEEDNDDEWQEVERPKSVLKAGLRIAGDN